MPHLQLVPLPDPIVDRAVVLRVAADTLADPRSVVKEVLALHGQGPHLRGAVGQRVRKALALHGVAPARAQASR